MTIRSLSTTALAAGAVAALFGIGVAQAEGIIGVSWRHFQEERWRIDERGITEVLAEQGGYEYVSADAQSSPEKQLADVESLLAQDIDALILLAQDANTIGPAVAAAQASGVPVIAYDAPIDAPDVLFMSFDNLAVGRLMAQGLVDARADGNWAILKGDASHSIVNLFWGGSLEVLQPLIDSGAITIVSEQNIENWKPDVAQSTMDQVLTANDNKVDVVLAMNDGIAGGVAAALASQGLAGVPVSGQDGDVAALNRIAKGEQTVTIWKNSYLLGRAAAEAAVALASGTPMEQVPGAVRFTSPGGVEQWAVLLEPIALTRDNLSLALDASWISKDQLCQGVTENPPAACQ